MLQKLQERQAMLKRMEYGEEDFQKWSKVLADCMMSSEESEDNEAIAIKPLPWRSELVSEFFEVLDSELMKDRSSQAKRQIKKRKISERPSSREKPSSMPPWATKETDN